LIRFAKLLARLEPQTDLGNLIGAPGGEQALGCPVLDCPLHPRCAVLGGFQGGQIIHDTDREVSADFDRDASATNG
jgi:hypothetical protein